MFTNDTYMDQRNKAVIERVVQNRISNAQLVNEATSVPELSVETDSVADVVADEISDAAADSAIGSVIESVIDGILNAL